MTIDIIYVVSAAILAWFGIQDTFGDASFGVHIRAAGMIAAALIVFVSAASAVLLYRDPSATSANTALLGAVLCAIFGLWLLLYQFTAGDSTPWLFAWIGMTVGGAWAAFSLVRAGARLWYPKQFAIALTVTTLLAVLNLAYSTLYQPSIQPYQFRVEVGMSDASLDSTGSTAYIPVSIAFENNGKVPATVLVAQYSVVGRVPASTPGGRDAALEAITEHRPVTRGTRAARWDLLQADEYIYPGERFEPGDRTDVGRTIDISLPTQYDVIGISASVVVMRADEAVLLDSDLRNIETYSFDEEGMQQSELPYWLAGRHRVYEDYVRYDVRFRESSYLREKTRADSVASILRILEAPSQENPPGHYLAFWLKPEEADLVEEFQVVDEDNRLALERYGLTSGWTGLYERSIFSLKIRKSADLTE